MKDMPHQLDTVLSELADLQTRATTINSLVAARVINPNEGRSWLGLAPYEGGNAFANPNITAAPQGDPPGEGEPLGGRLRVVGGE